jgi:hypothetical protein
METMSVRYKRNAEPNNVELLKNVERIKTEFGENERKMLDSLNELENLIIGRIKEREKVRKNFGAMTLVRKIFRAKSIFE